MVKIVKLKNKLDHYAHIQYQNKKFYDFQAGEIKPVDEDVANAVNKDVFEIVEEKKILDKPLIPEELKKEIPKKIVKRKRRKAK